MSESILVTVTVTRADGSTEQVPIGSALPSAEGFRLQLRELTIHAPTPRAAAARPPETPAATPQAKEEALLFAIENEIARREQVTEPPAAPPPGRRGDQ